MAKLLSFIIFVWLCGAIEAQQNQTPNCDASTFKHPVIPGAKVVSITTEEKHHVSTTVSLGGPGVSDISYCDVKLYLTHPGTNDNVLVQTWLPLIPDDWNGRFQATGGGGWLTGLFDMTLGPAIKAGYVASSTDGGHQGEPFDITWAIDDDGRVNWDLLQNFATRSLADQVYVGKSIAEQYYGKAPHHSYWNGCSQGGRQGYAVAQKYPTLLDGINAVAPALDLVNIAMGDFWPQFVMKEAGYLMSQCEFGAFLRRAVEDCDILDGVKDGIIEDPEICTFEPETLVGQVVGCDGKEVEISTAMADIVRKIWEGPLTPFGAQIWHGVSHATPMDWLANITVSTDGARSPKPLGLSSSFIQHLVVKDPSFNYSSLSYAEYVAGWAQATEQYSWLFADANHNLEAFRDAGGKLLTWHGTNDEIITYQNTIQYRKRVEAEMGGSKAVNEFYRLFLAPGVGHCGMGTGPQPTDSLAALVDWVEKGEPPERLQAAGNNNKEEQVTRDLCSYPQKSKYMGIGDGYRASSWTCEGGDDEEEEQLGGGGDFLGGLKDRLVQAGVDMGLRVG